MGIGNEYADLFAININSFIANAINCNTSEGCKLRFLLCLPLYKQLLAVVWKLLGKSCAVVRQNVTQGIGVCWGLLQMQSRAQEKSMRNLPVTHAESGLQGDNFIYLLLNTCVLHSAEPREPCSRRDCNARGLVAGNPELKGTKLEDVPRPHFSLRCHLFFCS